MKYALSILNWIKTNKMLAFVLIAAITFSLTQIFKAKGKANCEDCTPFKQQNKELISALIDIRKDLQGSVSTSYNPNPLLNAAMILPVIDTTPVIKKVLSKIDSILFKVKQDSLKQKSKS